MTNEPDFIMLIEDNNDHAELMIRTLQNHRIPNRVRHFLDGESALDYLFQRGSFNDPASAPRPLLVLLDLRLPRMDGIEVLKTIKSDENLKTIPVVILTTSDTDKDISSAYANHANSYLVKPVGYDEISDLLESFARYWLEWNAQPKNKD